MCTEGGLTVVAHPVVGKHGEARQHAIAGPDVGYREQKGIDLDALLQERQHGPLVAVVLVIPLDPDGAHLVDQVSHGREQAALARRDLADPSRVGVLCHGEQTQLAEHEREDGGGGRGQEQAGEAAEGRLGDGDKGGLVLVLAVELEGLEGADVAGDEGEDGHAEAALDEDAQKGQLQHLWGGVLGSGGPEEVAGPGARNVGEDDECRCEAAQALGGLAGWVPRAQRPRQQRTGAAWAGATHIHPLHVALLSNGHGRLLGSIGVGRECERRGRRGGCRREGAGAAVEAC
jgi:hypothetical protein